MVSVMIEMKYVDDIEHALTLAVNLRSIRSRMTEEALNVILIFVIGFCDPCYKVFVGNIPDFIPSDSWQSLV